MALKDTLAIRRLQTIVVPNATLLIDRDRDHWLSIWAGGRWAAHEDFCEVRFEDLEQDPVREVRRIYESLALPPFADVEPVVRRYMESLAGCSRNSFPPLSSATWQRVAQAWQRSFEEWGYAR